MWPHGGPVTTAPPTTWEQLLSAWDDFRTWLYVQDGGAVLLACGATCALVMLAIALTNEEEKS